MKNAIQSLEAQIKAAAQDERDARREQIRNDMRRHAADNLDLPCDDQERPYRFKF